MDALVVLRPVGLALDISGRLRWWLGIYVGIRVRVCFCARDVVSVMCLARRI